MIFLVLNIRKFKFAIPYSFEGICRDLWVNSILYVNKFIKLSLMKKILNLFLAMLFVPWVASAAETSTGAALVVSLVDGGKYQYIIDDDPRVTFDDENVYIKSVKMETSYAISTVSNFYFQDVTYSSVTDAGSADNVVVFRYTDREHVEITGNIKGHTVCLYGINGNALFSVKAADNSVKDVYRMIAITANQAIAAKHQK